MSTSSNSQLGSVDLVCRIKVHNSAALVVVSPSPSSDSYRTVTRAMPSSPKDASVISAFRMRNNCMPSAPVCSRSEIAASQAS
eukprot:CAMPEP_0195320622 /NCGR_PEP_ID=MMETSP0708-20121125/6187_1 /TAXON_ID=33640 /ORGANISM="Asterionellopsis glacialis, Strain CCMP134" /LENGTH=82 /DNA_ID=CAMNT_0040387015 /DNA_START=27 /DNA_END=275 /DNA_ORIENTATION=-